MHFSWSQGALDGLPQGVEPHEVMRALVDSRHVRRWLDFSDYTLLSIGCRTPVDAHLVVLTDEDEDDGWLIGGVRRMYQPEIDVYESFGGTDE